MKIKVGIVFGGKSGEHEVSIQSAANIFEALDLEKYEPFLLGVDKTGMWRFGRDLSIILNRENPKMISIAPETPVVEPIKGEDGTLHFFFEESGSYAQNIDVVFPIMHGSLGEDGCLQGFLKWMEIPFAGASVLGSAIGMDKDVAKRLLKERCVPVCRFRTYARKECGRKLLSEGAKELGYPLFVKPCNAGSSLGISKVKSENELDGAVERALLFDEKILLEESVSGRELECAVLGNDEPEASCFGEIVPKAEFYSYDAKYVDDDGAELIAPAELKKDIEAKMKAMAIKAFRTLECEGMARVDFFLRNGEEPLVNEINTLPGFTKISMYPKLWELSGLGYSKLLDRLIELGIERFDREKKLKTTAEF
jgi:D-alanine-D-alanine ligase